MTDYPAQPPQQPVYAIQPPEGGGGGVKFAILFGAVIALIAANVFLFLQIRDLKVEMAQANKGVLEEVDRVKESHTVSAAAARERTEALKNELDTARRQASVAVGQAKVDAEKHAEDLARKLEQQQRAAEQALRSEVSKVEQATDSKIGAVSTDVSSVRSEVSSTRSELEKTIADLRTTRGDLGVQSGLIATNSKELDALKRLAERNYFDINLLKTKTPQRFGDVLMQLKKSDVKKNRYTVDIIADDKRVEKKDKGVNEPVQFYTSKARQPYEIVINEVRKDQIIGYLATPKVQTGR